MTKTFIFISILFLSKLAIGQIHPTVKHIFYDLPLEKSRLDLREIIASDKRFTTSDTISNLFKNTMPYFLGVATDKGVVSSKPDSIEIHLSFANTTFANVKGGQQEYRTIMYLSLKYFYSNNSSVKAEYKNLIKMLSTTLKDSFDVEVKETYTSDPSRVQFKSIGKTFENFDPYYSVQILTTSMANNIYALNIEFRSEEK